MCFTNTFLSVGGYIYHSFFFFISISQTIDTKNVFIWLKTAQIPEAALALQFDSFGSKHFLYTGTVYS